RSRTPTSYTSAGGRSIPRIVIPSGPYPGPNPRRAVRLSRTSRPHTARAVQHEPYDTRRTHRPYVSAVRARVAGFPNGRSTALIVVPRRAATRRRGTRGGRRAADRSPSFGACVA